MLAALVTGCFGIVIVILQRQIHREVRSPNGTRTGDMVYELRQGLWVLDQRFAEHCSDDQLAQAEFRESFAALADQPHRSDS